MLTTFDYDEYVYEALKAGASAFLLKDSPPEQLSNAVRVVADGVNSLRSKERAIIVVTHYQRLLNYIIPDFVHVLYNGRIAKEGGKELALELEEKGYDWLKNGNGRSVTQRESR